MLGIPLERTAVEEGAAYGAALLGGVAGGVFADAHEAVEACVRVRDAVEPDPGWQETYERGYQRVPRSLPRPTTTGGAMTNLEGKAAFVTGASRGIGAAVARALSAAGVSVGLASRSGDDLGLRALVRPRLRRARSRGGGRRPSPPRSSASAGSTSCVANAGVGAYGPFLELSPEHLEEMIDVNLKGTMYAVRAALPHLLASGEARHRHARLRGRPARAALRGRLLRLEVRPGRASRARSTTSCASAACAARTSAPAESRPTSRSTRAAGGRRDVLPGMMTAEDVAEVVIFVLTRPRNHRILETALRPMTETSWG